MSSKKKAEEKVPAFLRDAQLNDVDSCLNKAFGDEPIFVLRANDETAPHLVRAWAEKYHEAKGRGMSEDQQQLAKYNQAYEIARAMEAWQLGLSATAAIPDEG